MGRPVSGVCWYLRKMKPFSLSQPHFFSQVGTLQFQFTETITGQRRMFIGGCKVQGGVGIVPLLF